MMDLTSMTPQIGILDDYDCPEAKMLVIVWGNPDHPHIEYINPKIQSLGRRGKFYNFPRYFTPIERFGARAGITAEESLIIWTVGESVAVYPDGVARRWQGRDIETIAMRRRVAGHVTRAVWAIQATEHEQPHPTGREVP